MTYRRDMNNPNYTSPDDPDLRRAFYEVLDASYSKAADTLRDKGFKVTRWVLDGAYTLIRAELKAYNDVIANLNDYLAEKEEELASRLAELHDRISELEDLIQSGEEVTDNDGNPIDLESQVKMLRAEVEALEPILDLVQNPKDENGNIRKGVLALLKPDWACLPIWE